MSLARGRAGGGVVHFASGVDDLAPYVRAAQLRGEEVTVQLDGVYREPEPGWKSAKLGDILAPIHRRGPSHGARPRRDQRPGLATEGG
jgi:hypothetical protein